MDQREQQAPRYPLPEVIQPAPMLVEHRNPFGTAMVYVGATAIVALVLYGLTRPEGPRQQMANAPSPATQTAPAGGAPAAPQPSTTGQGQSGDQAKPAKSQGQPARSDSANDTGAKNQPRQQAQ